MSACHYSYAIVHCEGETIRIYRKIKDMNLILVELLVNVKVQKFLERSILLEEVNW